MEQLTYKQSWFGNIKGDILSGLVVALALIPEAIAFSIVSPNYKNKRTFSARMANNRKS